MTHEEVRALLMLLQRFLIAFDFPPVIWHPLPGEYLRVFE
jgi:hypothetical protein